MKMRFESRDSEVGMIKKHLSNGLLVPLFLLTTGTASFPSEDHNAAKDLREAGEILSLEQIIEKAKKYTSGRILEAELEKERGQFIYEIEILDDEGVVWELKYNAKTGELIKTEKDD